MVTIKQIDGLDTRLYQLVAPLVMNPDVLKQNRNYPFKTNKNYQWLIAIQDREVAGFLPIEFRDKQAIINNYYTAKESHKILDCLIKAAINSVEEKFLLVSVTQSQHVAIFQQNGFVIEREWKNYVKMRKVE